jgi:RNA-binding protein NOB1
LLSLHSLKISEGAPIATDVVGESAPSESVNTKGAEEVSQPVDEAITPDAEEASEDLEELAQQFKRMPLDSTNDIPDSAAPTQDIPSFEAEAEALYEDPSESDDGQGDWITPTNVALRKSRALDLLPDAAEKSKSKKRMALPQPEKVDVGCMTADYAMQNVLMHMGLNLVGVEGTRISSVKSWVLRCHACFK